MDHNSLKRSIYDAKLNGANMKPLIRDRHIQGFDPSDLDKNEALFREQFGDEFTAAYIEIAMTMREQLKKFPMTLEGYLLKSLGVRQENPPPTRVPRIEDWLLEAALDVCCAEDETFLAQARELVIDNWVDEEYPSANDDVDSMRKIIVIYLRGLLKVDGLL